MKKFSGTQICFVSKDGEKLICNAIDRFGDGQLWETISGKWIPIPLEDGVRKTATTSLK